MEIENADVKERGEHFAEPQLEWGPRACGLRVVCIK